MRICHRNQSVSHSHNETVVTLQLSLRKMANVFAGNTCSLFILSNQQSWSELLAPLVNMIKEGCENESALLIILIICRSGQRTGMAIAEAWFCAQ